MRLRPSLSAISSIPARCNSSSLDDARLLWTLLISRQRYVDHHHGRQSSVSLPAIRQLRHRQRNHPQSFLLCIVDHGPCPLAARLKLQLKQRPCQAVPGTCAQIQFAVLQSCSTPRRSAGRSTAAEWRGLGASVTVSVWHFCLFHAHHPAILLRACIGETEGSAVDDDPLPFPSKNLLIRRM